ncbi:hypothetical protein WN55_03022 [Dufourea novaeangliae]|uniref:Uncharacterized protein n=2 Tax=Dufourea novaeangliae TaxID=178035 RepID=A0A154PHT6_DUFNO|nr:hypothetical protein WN55_03022 [Dufourea novaeangliae]
MSRCVTLLMQVLKETNDGRMLMQLSVQLGKIPESDKKYLRDSEREQLSRQALTLCLQSLRTKVQLMGTATPDSSSNKTPDSRTQVLLDTYWVYQRALKSFQTKEQTIQTLSALLVDTYKTYVGNKNLEGNVLEIASKFCNDYNYNRKVLNKFLSNFDKPSTDVQVQPQATSPIPVVTSQSQISSPSPQSSQSRKPYKNITSTGRPRGRPPNVNKYLQAMQQSGHAMNQFNAKANFANYMGASGNRSLMNPYFMHPLVDPNILSAILTSGLSGSMMDHLSAMNYLNQMGNYQDILRQYQNNLSSLSNLASGLNSTIASATNINTVPTMSTSNINATPSMNNLGNLNNLTVQQLLSLSNSTASTARATPMYQQAATTKTTTTTAALAKDRPSISITPVNTVPPKNKLSKQNPQGESSSLPVQLPKSLQMSQPSKPVLQPPTTQVSLLKPSVVQHVKTSPPKQMSAPQIRVSKSLTEPQPAHNPSLSHSPLKSNVTANSTAAVPQVAHSVVGPSISLKQSLSMNVAPSHSGTSLQHKLLSKKNSQRSYTQASTQNPIRKTKSSKTMPPLPSNFSNLLSTLPGNSSMTQPPYIPPELSGISVSPINPQPGLKGPSTKYSNYKKSTGKTKTSASMEISTPLPNSFAQSTTSAEALSMLSQLKQHSHLEIIPQQKAQMKSTMEYPKSLSSGVTVVPQKMSDPLRPSTTDCMTIYDLPRGKSSSISSKKGEKSVNDSVEIITLDD